MKKLLAFALSFFCFLPCFAQLKANAHPGDRMQRSNAGDNSEIGIARIQKAKKPFKAATTYYIQKGDWMLDGGVNFKSSWYETNSIKYTTTRFGLHPQIGYFVIDQLEAELGLSFRTTNE